ncbi:MAG TPA: sialate O-acetylesterase [Armatimonadota bacterium]|nr:sialate O-acetylesterase [Armatimonadota bacterium]
MRKSVIIVLAAVLIAGSAFAAVTPDPLFSDNAVLQQGMRLPVWGTADAGEKVTVKFQGQEVSTVAMPSGHWMLHLKPLKAGGPFTMTINDQQIKNVLVGEVWVCSGQSNMAFQLNRATNGEQAVADSKDPMLRLFLVPKMRDPFTLPKAWTESSPDSSTTFSAVGYFFGQKLRKDLGVPVGLIDSSVGGTPAEAWTSRPCLSPHPELNGVARPYYLYNSMIAPLIPYGIRGAIWYQGEGNAGRAYAYRSLLPLMIKCWRDAWGEGDFPFLIVQLAPYGKQKRPDANWPELREAELYVTQTVPNTGLAVTMDVGNCENIHPTQKEPVGQRLALDAEAMVYGKKVEYSGPAYKSMAVEDNSAVLSFAHIGGGLTAVGGELKGFTIAGEDKNFVPATAVIQGDQVLVSSPEVPKPVAVRYGWDDCPDANLMNGAMLPASPFRTDDWGWVTKPQ